MATPNFDAYGALKESPVLLQMVLDTLPVGVMITDSGGKALMLNKAIEAIWPGKRELTGFSSYTEYTAWDIKTGKKVEPHQWPVSIAIETGQPTEDYEFKIERFDGTRGYMKIRASPIIDAAGNVTGAVGVSLDITARKEAEEATAGSLLLEQRIKDEIYPLSQYLFHRTLKHCLRLIDL